MSYTIDYDRVAHGYALVLDDVPRGIFRSDRAAHDAAARMISDRRSYDMERRALTQQYQRAKEVVDDVVTEETRRCLPQGRGRIT